MPGPYSAGAIFLQIIPSFRGTETDISREGREIARHLGRGFDEEFEKNVGTGLKRGIDKGAKGARDSSRKAGKDAGDEYAGAFQESLQRALKSAEREVGTIKIRADDRDMQKVLRAVKRDLAVLTDSNAEIGIDLNPSTAYRKLADLETSLRRLNDESADIDVRVNSAVAMASIEKVRADLMSLSAIQVEPDIKIDRQMGNFERSFKAAIKGAIDDIGEQRIDMHATVAERDLAEIRRQLFELGDKRIGIDISSEAATLELARLRDELHQITRESWKLDVDVNSAAARAKLDSILDTVRKLDGDDVNVDVNVRSAASAVASLAAVHAAQERARTSAQDGANAFRGFNGVLFTLTTVGPALIPVLGAVTGALAAAGPLAIAAAAGVGVFALALSGIGGAVKAMNQEAATAVTQQQTFARAQRSAANAVRDAEQSVQAARESAARSAAASSRAVEQALEGVQQAERGVADAQRNRQQAQEDLNRAIRDAVEQQEDLALALRGSRIDEQEAALRLRQAQEELATTDATGDELLELQLRVERYQLALDRARERTGDLQEQTDEFARTGVEGTDAVRSARQRLADADQQIADAQRRVADAQQAVADARLAQQQDAADSSRTLRDAQEQLTDAQLRYTEALENVNSAQNKVNEAMKNLSPAGRDFARFIFGLKDEFQEFRYIAQEGFLPGLQDWIQSIVVIQGPALQRTIFNLSEAVGDMFSDFGSALLSKPFQDLFRMIENDGPRFIGYMSDVLVNLGKGVASLVVAMGPLADLFGGWLVGVSRRFADWAGGVQGSRGLQEFIEYIQRVGPEVGEFVEQLGRALLNLAKGLAPYAEAVLRFLTGFLRWIADMDPQKLGIIATGLIIFVGAVQTVFGLAALARAFESAMRLSGSSVGFFAGQIGTFLGSAALFAGAIYIMYQNSESFRQVIDFVWNKLLVPFGDFLGSVFNPIIDDLATILENLAVPIGLAVTAWAGWKILLTVVGWVTALRTALLGLTGATAAAVASGGLAGVMRAGGLSSAARAGLTGAVAGAGLRAAPWVAAVYGAYKLQTNVDDERVNDWAKILASGGREAEALRQRYMNVQDEGFFARTFGGTNLILGDLWDDDNRNNVIGDFEAAQQAADDYWKTLPLVEQAQMKVAEWSQTLAYRQKHLGEQDDETAAAHRRLEYWTKVLERAQGAAEGTTRSMTQSLLEQQQVAIALASADIAYSQAVASLDKAHQDYVDTLNNAEASEEERAAALDTYINQSLATAQAAAQVAAARHQNADAADAEQYKNAALLLDLERQKDAYGELPPRLEELRQSLEDTVPAAFIAQTQMENLGIKIREIPDEKTIIFDGEPTQEQIDLMEDLGFKIETLPDGTVTAVAETADAEAALDLVARDRTSTITQTVGFVNQANYKAHANREGTGGFGFARGGPIWGPGTPTSDSIPAWLSNGEYVIRAAAVSKYGLGFFDAVNAMHFAKGGPVTGYAGGGYVANWGGTIDLKGGDVSPLAQLWVEAIMQINQLSQIAADMIANNFRQMRDAVLTELTLGKDGAAAILGQQMATMLSLTVAANNAMYADHLRYAGQWLNLTMATHRTVQAQYISFGGSLLQVMGATTSALLTSWASFGSSMINVTTGAVNIIGAQFDRLRHLTADPINFVILAVLNNGLFKALNGLSTTFGLPQVPTATPIGKFAAGGPIDGFSPHKRADNIPAWLTAGEFVQPVDTVDYYGADFMELLRRRLIPRELLPGFASGGPATWQRLDEIRRHLFPGSVLTSGYRPGSKDYHGLGMAIDIGVPGNVVAKLIPIAQTLARMYPQSAEIINNPGASVKNGRVVPPSFWGASTWAQHANHVHWAMTMAQLLLGPGVGGATPADVFGQLAAAIDAPVKKLVADFGDSPFVGMLAAIPAKLLTGVWSKIEGTITDALSFGGGDGSLAGAQTTGPVQDIVRSVARQFGWDSGAQWDALAWIIQRESGWRPTAQNPTSTAYGLFQFLNGTWAGTGIAKTSDPAQQSLAGMRYIKNRYGDPLGAQRFWRANGWYSEGGEVGADGPITPELMDTGGWIHPGLNVIMNKTGRPEPVINPATLDALISIGESGGGDKTFIINPAPGMNEYELALAVAREDEWASR